MDKILCIVWFPHNAANIANVNHEGNFILLPEQFIKEY